MSNIYFDLTRELNARGTIAVLASGQAVVFYRIAIMSKDGDWVLRETEDACQHALAVMAAHGAHYRPGAPLDLRWLAGSWSSHFEFMDAEQRRVRCDFVTRPPRLTAADLAELFVPREGRELPVIDVETLIVLKRTQRAKDYPVIAELARLLLPGREIELTVDPDRILELAPRHGDASTRPPVILAHSGSPRREVVLALAEEIDNWQQADQKRLARYEQAARPYLKAFRAARIGELPLDEAHQRVLTLATELLPATLPEEVFNADAE